MATPSSLEYTPLLARVEKSTEPLFLPDDQMTELLAEFAHVKPRPENKDGDIEVLEGQTFTHHFVLGPGDGEVIRWHYVEAGPKDGGVVVFLHGIPDSWYQWYQQMAVLAKTYCCIAPDLKGYGQSGKDAGDYHHEGARE